MALDVTSRLKAEEHVLAEVVSSQDRKITWKDDHFPVNPVAHYGMISNLIHAEVQATLKGDADVVVTDRSALDLYAIASYDHPDSTLIKDLGVMVKAWTQTYTRIYYLPPLAYQEDGKRPSDDFRMKTHGRLLDLMNDWQLPNLVAYSRSDAYKDIKTLLGIKSKNPDLGVKAKWEYIAEACGCVIGVKAQKSVVTSDEDVWFLFFTESTADVAAEKFQRAKKVTELCFGRTIDLMAAPITIASELVARGDVTFYLPSVDLMKDKKIKAYLK